MAKTCFVIQGFGEKTDFPTGRKLNLDASYEVIKEAAEAAGLDCIRADEIPHAGVIDRPMFQQILEADLVIADLSTYNLNAAYELGVRHALRPRTTIIVAESQFKYPFDFSHIVIRPYEHLGPDLGRKEAKRFQTELKDSIGDILAAAETDSPVYTFLDGLSPPSWPALAVAAAEPTAPTSLGLVDLAGPSELMGVAPADLGPPGRAAGMTSDVGVLGGVEEEMEEEVDEEMEGGGGEGAAAEEVEVEVEPEPVSARNLMEQARACMKDSDFVRAVDLWKKVQDVYRDPYVVQQLALATYKSRSPDPVTALRDARKLVMDGLDPDSTNDPETLGLWGAIHKRLFDETGEKEELSTAVRSYERGFYLKQDYYNGINLAFLLNLRGVLRKDSGEDEEALTDRLLARRVREEVVRLCLALVPEDAAADAEEDLAPEEVEDRYWVYATLWEASVGLYDRNGAEKWRAQAEGLEPPGWMLDSTWRQIQELEGLLAKG